MPNKSKRKPVTRPATKTKKRIDNNAVTIRMTASERRTLDVEIAARAKELGLSKLSASAYVTHAITSHAKQRNIVNAVAQQRHIAVMARGMEDDVFRRGVLDIVIETIDRMLAGSVFNRLGEGIRLVEARSTGSVAGAPMVTEADIRKQYGWPEVANEIKEGLTPSTAARPECECAGGDAGGHDLDCRLKLAKEFADG